MLNRFLTLRVLLAASLFSLWVVVAPVPLGNAEPGDDPRVFVAGLSDKEFSLTDANLTSNGGEIRNCEPRVIYVLFKGKTREDALLPFGYLASASVDGKPLKVTKASTGVLGGSAPLFRMSFALEDRAPPGNYVLTLTHPKDELPPLEIAVRFTC